MCGVAAIFAFDPRAEPVDRTELRTIRDAMRTRGPDGSGEWLSADGRVGLAHRRLSIIDLSDAAAQPMLADDGSNVIAFNGEIYNFRDLRAALSAEGHRFRTTSDTEVLLELYRTRGTAMLAELRGEKRADRGRAGQGTSDHGGVRASQVTKTAGAWVTTKSPPAHASREHTTSQQPALIAPTWRSYVTQGWLRDLTP